MRARLVNVLLLLMITSCIIFVSAQEGFTSIDCGGKANFTDSETKIQWTTDDGYLLFGQTDTLAEDYLTGTEREMRTVRSFPEGNKNCYELKATNGTKYLVRVKFLYGNFDRKSSGSGYLFHLIIDTVIVIRDVTKAGNRLYHELIFVAASDIISVCFGKERGTPFVNTIELRTLPSRMYPRASTDSILWVDHYNIQYDRVPIIRYPNDRYDRYWKYWNMTSGGKSIETDEQIRTGNSTDEVPQTVMKTGVEAVNDTLSDFAAADYRFQSSQTLFFADFQANSSRRRKFNIQISIDGALYGDAVVQPGYLNASSIEMKLKAPVSESSKSYDVNFISIDNSTFPPILNAWHDAWVIPRSGETHPEEVNAMRKIRDHFEVIEWSGDPCLPLDYSWDKVMCSNNNPVRVLSIDMSNMNLSQSVTETFVNLTALKILNLANNNPFGYFPDGLFKSHLLQINYSNNPKLRRRIHGLTRMQKNITIGIVVPIAIIAIVVGLLYLRPD